MDQRLFGETDALLPLDSGGGRLRVLEFALFEGDPVRLQRGLPGPIVASELVDRGAVGPFVLVLFGELVRQPSTFRIPRSP